jgi:hypothetical protein
MNIVSFLASSSSSGPPIGGILVLIFLIWLFILFCQGVAAFFKWLTDQNKGWTYEEHRRGILKKNK